MCRMPWRATHKKAVVVGEEEEKIFINKILSEGSCSNDGSCTTHFAGIVISGGDAIARDATCYRNNFK